MNGELVEEQDVEQDLDIALEMQKITFAGMQGETELRESIAKLCGHFGVESTSPTPLDISKDMQSLILEYMSGGIDEEDRDEQIPLVLSKALTASSPLSIPQS